MCGYFIVGGTLRKQQLALSSSFLSPLSVFAFSRSMWFLSHLSEHQLQQEPGELVLLKAIGSPESERIFMLAIILETRRAGACHSFLNLAKANLSLQTALPERNRDFEAETRPS